MDISHLVRNAEAVHSALQETDKTLIALEPCKIYFPEAYMGGELGYMGDVIRVCAIYGIVVKEKFLGVSRACALMETAPSVIDIVVIGAMRYYEFIYKEGDEVIRNLDLVRLSTLVYRIYNEFITNGKVPWYFDYNDLAFIFDTALLHGGADLRTDSTLLEMIAAVMARQTENKFLYSRHDPRLQRKNYSKKVISYVGMKSVIYQATNTSARLSGNYFNEGVTSALIATSTTNENIEDLIRG